METERRRKCICTSYVITALLIGVFIYVLVANNVGNNKRLARLREEVDEIAHMVLHNTHVGPGDSKQLSEIVDTILKKRLSGIWDDLYTLKKQLKAVECPSLTLRSKPPTEAVAEVVEERVNYASEDLGARIQHAVAEPIGGTNIFKSLLRLDFSANPPVCMLRQKMDAGNCFAFKNNISEVTVKLAKEISVETIEMEHISIALSPTSDVSSAPRHFGFFGLDSQANNEEVLLGNFEYENVPSKRTQLFDLEMVARFHFVRFKFESNHGNPNYTCVYRIAVYGRI